MEKERLEIFGLLPKFKYIDREYLIIGIKITYYLAKMYIKHKAYKKYKWKEWKNGMIMYCIDNMLTWEQAIDSLIEEKII